MKKLKAFLIHFFISAAVFFDFMVIIAVQILALIYGTYTLYQERGPGILHLVSIDLVLFLHPALT
jgi:hypothetical protein